VQERGGRTVCARTAREQRQGDGHDANKDGGAAEGYWHYAHKYCGLYPRLRGRGGGRRRRRGARAGGKAQHASGSGFLSQPPRRALLRANVCFWEVVWEEIPNFLVTSKNKQNFEKKQNAESLKLVNKQKKNGISESSN